MFAKFFTEMYTKVKVVLIMAVIASVNALLDTLVSADWTTSVGPWAVPIGIGLAWIVARWKRETSPKV